MLRDRYNSQILQHFVGATLRRLSQNPKKGLNSRCGRILKNESGQIEETRTGNYIFENEWQSFRTRKNKEIEFTSAPYEYNQPGKYKIMVKVVDILGIDTSQTIEVEIK